MGGLATYVVSCAESQITGSLPVLSDHRNLAVVQIDLALHVRIGEIEPKVWVSSLKPAPSFTPLAKKEQK